MVTITLVGLSPFQAAVVFLLALTMWLVVMMFTLHTVIAATSLPPPVTLVVALTAITLVAIAGFVITDSKELATLAGLGMGALSGACAATWQATKKKDEHGGP
jgi:hypothetical protein